MLGSGGVRVVVFSWVLLVTVVSRFAVARGLVGGRFSFSQSLVKDLRLFSNRRQRKQTK